MAKVKKGIETEAADQVVETLAERTAETPAPVTAGQVMPLVDLDQVRVETLNVPVVDPLDQLPSADWTPMQLGEYARRQVKQGVKCIWRMGLAMNLAEPMVPQGDWRKFVVYYTGLSYETATRYCRLAKLCKDEAALEGLTKTQAYAKYGIVVAAPKDHVPLDDWQEEEDKPKWLKALEDGARKRQSDHRKKLVNRRYRIKEGKLYVDRTFDDGSESDAYLGNPIERLNYAGESLKSVIFAARRQKDVADYYCKYLVLSMERLQGMLTILQEISDTGICQTDKFVPKDDED